MKTFYELLKITSNTIGTAIYMFRGRATRAFGTESSTQNFLVNGSRVVGDEGNFQLFSRISGGAGSAPKKCSRREKIHALLVRRNVKHAAFKRDGVK